jgi:DNA repair protein RecN (Recombination protein N)
VLQQLTIRNFATIVQLSVEWQPGLNVITGETGAGKSILIDAVGALLGDRLGPEVVRSGAERALVECVFVLPDPCAPELRQVLDEYGLEPEDGELIVTREIGASGSRGGARVNGRSVPLSVLQAVGGQLVDVHGQSEHMALLRTREQLDYLDRYAGTLPERTTVGVQVRELRNVRDAVRKLSAEEREAARLQDMLRHEIAEIERAELRPDEEDELKAQQTRLQHVERLRQSAHVAHVALAGADSGDRADTAGALDLLAEALSACSDAARFDAALEEQVETLNTALAHAQESAAALREYVDRLEPDPQALERITGRLFLIGDLQRKYGDSIAEVLAYAADAQRRLAAIEHRSEHQVELQQQEQRLLLGLTSAAAKLSGLRKAAAERLASAVEQELADLRLGGTRFTVALNQTDDFDATGSDRIEFLLAANPGEEPRAMARVASGGELSRIALALKTILSRAETRPTLIFDEIDVGVGGRTAPVVGEKLRSVASGGHQVLCVTHLPQVAAFADAHYVVSKALGERAETSVELLSDAARIEELAAMLAGAATEAGRESARELLDGAASVRPSSEDRSADGRLR